MKKESQKNRAKTGRQIRKSAPSAFKFSAADYKRFLDQAPLAISISRGEKILYVNRAYRQLYAVPSGTRLAGCSHMIFVAPEERERIARFSAQRNSADGTAPDAYDSLAVRMDGKRIPVHINVSQIKLIDGPAEIVIIEDISERRQMEQHIDYLTRFDPVTNLANRSFFYESVAKAIEKARQSDSALAVLIIEINHFSEIEDAVGHSLGNIILQMIARFLKKIIPDQEAIARMRGNEFAAVLENCKDAAEIRVIAEKILAIFQRPFSLSGKDFHLTANIGISLFPENGSDPETLIANADIAMARAKIQGSNTFMFFTAEMSRESSFKVALKGRMHKALELEEFVLHYQPVIKLDAGEAVGAEALLRWKHPEFGLLSPLMFINLAEETGFILQLGEWVLRKACQQAKEWQNNGSSVKVAVNLSAFQFQQSNLLSLIKDILAENSLNPEQLELEITESTAMWDLEQTVRVLKQLRETGVCVAIDDFGVGYSSFNYLKKFPVNTIKIDRTFIKDLATNYQDAAIVRAVINIAHSLKMQVVAEGVETSDQLDFLKSADCDFVQGFLFSKPQEPSGLVSFFQKK